MEEGGEDMDFKIYKVDEWGQTPVFLAGDNALQEHRVKVEERQTGIGINNVLTDIDVFREIPSSAKPNPTCTSSCKVFSESQDMPSGRTVESEGQGTRERVFVPEELQSQIKSPEAEIVKSDDLVKLDPETPNITRTDHVMTRPETPSDDLLTSSTESQPDVCSSIQLGDIGLMKQIIQNTHTVEKMISEVDAHNTVELPAFPSFTNCIKNLSTERALPTVRTEPMVIPSLRSHSRKVNENSPTQKEWSLQQPVKTVKSPLIPHDISQSEEVKENMSNGKELPFECSTKQTMSSPLGQSKKENENVPKVRVQETVKPHVIQHESVNENVLKSLNLIPANAAPNSQHVCYVQNPQQMCYTNSHPTIQLNTAVSSQQLLATDSGPLFVLPQNLYQSPLFLIQPPMVNLQAMSYQLLPAVNNSMSFLPAPVNGIGNVRVQLSGIQELAVPTLNVNSQSSASEQQQGKSQTSIPEAKTADLETFVNEHEAISSERKSDGSEVCTKQRNCGRKKKAEGINGMPESSDGSSEHFSPDGHEMKRNPQATKCSGVTDTGQEKSFARPLKKSKKKSKRSLFLDEKKKDSPLDMRFGNLLFDAETLYSLLFEERSESEFMCRNCKEVLITKEAALGHIHAHHPFKCKVCDVTFSTCISLSIHSRSVHDEQFHCRQCLYCSPSITKLEKHIKEEHGSKDHVTLKLCHICGQTFREFDSVEKHLQEVHGSIDKVTRDGVFSCPICDHSCGLNAALRTHMMKHAGMFKFCKFEGCKYTSVLQSKLDHHYKYIHLGERSFPCPFEGCTVTSKQSRELTQHLRDVHYQERNHRCEHCNKCFIERKHLRVHLLIHSDAKPIACNHCDYRCRQRAALNWHMDKQHPELVEEKAKISYYLTPGVPALKHHMKPGRKRKKKLKAAETDVSDCCDSSSQMKPQRKRKKKSKAGAKDMSKTDVFDCRDSSSTASDTVVVTN